MGKERKPKSLFLALVLTGCLMFLAGIAFAAEPKYGGTLRIGTRLAQENSIDARQPQTIPTVPGTEMIYDRLFTWGEKGYESLIPGLALNYQTKDNIVWTVSLR